MEQATPFQHARAIMDVLRSYREARVLISFAELGIGDVLAAGPQTAAAVAAAVGTDVDATDRLLNAARLLGLVERHGDTYRLTPLASDTLTSGGAASLLNFARREAAFYRRWAHLTEAVRIGGRPAASLQEEQDPNWVRAFTLALYDTARIAAPGIVQALEPIIEGLNHPARVIDVGGGHGGYSLALARRFPTLRATVFDLPPVIEVTRDLVAASGLADRVTVVAGDFHQDPLGSGYDVALLFGVLVGEDREGSLRLLRTVRAALAPGGYAVVRSHHAGRQGDASLNGALFDLQMLLSTRGGSAHEVADILGWMREAGFVDLRTIDAPEPASGSLLVGRAPA
ncbi:MAG: methyltransferase [Sphaerobacter sp.]|nr:methyltransferase [Sphaerobacter sp.]